MSYEQESDAYMLQLSAVLLDDSHLKLRDYLFADGSRKYVYQWMEVDGTLRQRWDNAPQWVSPPRPRRARLRAELAYILDTFPIARRKDEERYGEYRTKRMVLAQFDKLSDTLLQFRENRAMFQVLLPAEFHEQHRRIVLEFVRCGHEFGRDEWRQAIVAFDLLKNAAVLTDRGLLPFPVIYRQHVEEPYADDFIEALYLAARVDEASISRWATVARDVGPRLAQVGLLRPDVPATRLIVAYCLYWWRAFTLGYALEVKIQRDLEASGIQFQAHDLRRREERLSPYDLIVLSFRGDIKTSTYFLQATRTRMLPHDFYITRIRGQQRTRTMVVFVQTEMWQTINGETLLVLLEQVINTLPQAARIVHEGVELTVVDYDTWKAKVRRCQASGTSDESEECDGSTNY